MPLGDDAIVASAECNRWSTKLLATGTAKLNAHVLTERLSSGAFCQISFGALLDRWWADRRFSGKPCGSCRVICSLSHARLRGYLFLSRSIRLLYLTSKPFGFPLFLQPISSSTQNSLIFQSDATLYQIWILFARGNCSGLIIYKLILSFSYYEDEFFWLKQKLNTMFKKPFFLYLYIGTRMFFTYNKNVTTYVTFYCKVKNTIIIYKNIMREVSFI